MASNVGKWKTYQDGSKLYGPSGSGQNLNADLQAAVADEIDAILAEIVGDLVLGLAVTPSTGLAVNVAAGGGYIGGQRIVLSAPTVVGSLPPSTSGIKVYLQAGTPWSGALKGWPATVAATTGALGAGQYLLATVTTDPTSVTQVVDARILADGLSTIGVTVDDTVTPAATAQSVQRRLSMFARRIKDLLGSTSWLDAAPATLTSLVAALADAVGDIAALVAEFDASSGHTHTGAAGDAPVLPAFSPSTGHSHDGAAGGGAPVDAADVVVTPTGGIAANRVQAALAELDAEKLALGGGTLTGALLLAADPSQALGAATKQYVDGKAATSAWATGPGSPAYGSTTTFTVTGDQSAHYYPGRLIRYKTTGGGSSYLYSMVKTYAAGTVTIVAANLDSGLSSLQVANLESVKLTFGVSGRMPSSAENNLGGRFRVGAALEPVAADLYVEVMASTNGASSGNTGIRVRRGSSPTADGATDVLAGTNLAYNASSSVSLNPTHTEIPAGEYLQVDITAAPTNGQADDLFVVLHCLPKWAKNL